MRIRSLGLLLLPVILALGVAALAAMVLPERHQAAERSQLRELVLRDVVPTADSAVVVLQAVDDRVVIPVLVSSSDGDAIRAARMGEAEGDTLLERAVGSLGGVIRGVLIDGDEGGDVGGKVLLEGKGEPVPIDASAGAAIAAAISTGRPIFATPHTLEASGLGPEEIKQMMEADEHQSEQDAQPVIDL